MIKELNDKLQKADDYIELYIGLRIGGISGIINPLFNPSILSSLGFSSDSGEFTGGIARFRFAPPEGFPDFTKFHEFALPEDLNEMKTIMACIAAALNPPLLFGKREWADCVACLMEASETICGIRPNLICEDETGRRHKLIKEACLERARNSHSLLPGARLPSDPTLHNDRVERNFMAGSNGSTIIYITASLHFPNYAKILDEIIKNHAKEAIAAYKEEHDVSRN